MDKHTESLINLFWTSFKSGDHDTTEMARTALYDHLVGQIITHYQKTGQDASQITLYHPDILKVIKARTQADKAILDRMAKGYQYLAQLYKDDPVDRSEKATKALDLLDSLDDFLNRPHSMIHSGDGFMKVVHVKAD